MPEPAEPIRVLIADDAYVIREGIAAALETEPEIEVVAMCADGDELRAAIASTHPEVVITDARMPPSGEGEGIRIAARLRETAPEIGVILLTQYSESAYAIALMDGGTSRRAYLLKDRVASRAQLLDVIRTVAAGGSVIDPLVVEVLIQGRMADPASAIDQLTPREQEILAQIAQGKSNTAIADSLFLTKRAVEKHVNSIFAKLDLPGPETVSRRVKATLMYLADADHAGPYHP